MNLVISTEMTVEIIILTQTKPFSGKLFSAKNVNFSSYATDDDNYIYTHTVHSWDLHSHLCY